MKLHMDSPAAVIPALAHLDVGTCRVVYHGNPPVRDDWDGMVLIDHEELHGHFYWPKVKDQAKAQKAAGELVKVAKAWRGIYPRATLGLYGLPSPAYWLDGQGLRWINDDGTLEAEAVAWFAEAMGPLLEHVDFVAPSVYDPYPTKATAALEDPDVAYMRARVRIAKATGKPVHACCSPTWMVNGVPATMMSMADWLSGQVLAAVIEGAEGLIMWGAWEYWIGRACAAPLTTDDKPTIAASRVLMQSVISSMQADTAPIDDDVWWATRRDMCAAAVCSRIHALGDAAARVTRNVSPAPRSRSQATMELTEAAPLRP